MMCELCNREQAEFYGPTPYADRHHCLACHESLDHDESVENVTQSNASPLTDEFMRSSHVGC